MNILFSGLLLITALMPDTGRLAQPQEQVYTTTVMSNVPATLGCVWGTYVCDVQCASCQQATCASDTVYDAVGTCISVTTEGIISWNASGTPSITTLDDDGWLQALWDGYAYQGEQSVTYMIVLEGSDSGDDWSFPTEPLLPYQFGEPEETIDAPITAARLWEAARIALTSYHIISGEEGATWLLFAGILLLPIAGAIIYRLLTSPPEI